MFAPIYRRSLDISAEWQLPTHHINSVFFLVFLKKKGSLSLILMYDKTEYHLQNLVDFRREMQYNKCGVSSNFHWIWSRRLRGKSKQWTMESLMSRHCVSPCTFYQRFVVAAYSSLFTDTRTQLVLLCTNTSTTNQTNETLGFAFPTELRRESECDYCVCWMQENQSVSLTYKKFIRFCQQVFRITLNFP